jgi:hypothetical protein
VNKTLFIVRLRKTHRLFQDYRTNHIIRPTRAAETVFSSRDHAEAFAQEQTPVDVNPFGSVNELSFDNGIFTRQYLENNGNGIWASEYNEEIRKTNLPVPTMAETYTTTNWIQWWDSATQDMTIAEKQKLKSRLTIAAVYSNPFDWTIIKNDLNRGDSWIEDVKLHEFTQSELEKQLAPLPIPYLETSHNELDHARNKWWELHKNQLSDSQKAGIWKLVDPYPYEIVEVELG